ncbi:MAG: hypothetical protein U0003_04635 [Vampirovibrionales bacterium]
MGFCRCRLPHTPFRLWPMKPGPPDALVVDGDLPSPKVFSLPDLQP